MATIKSYTDLEQSRKLAKILPIESADMFYKAGNETQPTFRLHSYGHIMSDKDVCAWSLAALLGVLPNGIVMNKDSQNGKYHSSSKYIETYVTAGNPIDACVAMILKLKELSLL